MNLLNKTVLILINSCHCCSHPTIACSGGSSQIPREQFPCPGSLLKLRLALNYPYREVCWVHGCWASAFLWLLRKCFPPKKERVSGLQRMGSDHSLQLCGTFPTARNFLLSPVQTMGNHTRPSSYFLIRGCGGLSLL